MPVEVTEFGRTQDGQEISLFTMINSHGHRVQLTNYGAILVSVEVPDRDGQLANVNLGYSSLDGYLDRHPYFGSTVGRFCNRIAAGKFELEGQSYSLAINNGPNHLHGGIVGFDKHVWKYELVDDGVLFSTISPDGEEGYPGELHITAKYTWNDQSELIYSFEATTQAPTVLNLTNHAYWNLSGAGNGTIHDHELKLQCARSLEVDDSLIPTGTILETAGTVLDFHEFRKLGERLEELPGTKGYDHCYVVDGEAGGEPRSCALARDPVSGRTMEVLTTQPGMQLYTGNHLEGDFEAHSGFCLETQHYPDSPNKPDFPSTRLDPGQTFEETTIHRFGVTQ